MVKETGSPSEAYRIAVASSDGIVVNQHFGRARLFNIYEIDAQGQARLIEKRDSAPVCQGGEHDPEEMAAKVECLRDCRYVLVSRIGPGAANALEMAGISPVELPGMIDESIGRLRNYIELQNFMKEALGSEG